MSRLGGVALTSPSLHTERISEYNLNSHLQVVYYKCVKFHKNPTSRLGGIAITRYMDRRTDGQCDSYIPPSPNFVCGGYNYTYNIV